MPENIALLFVLGFIVGSAGICMTIIYIYEKWTGHRASNPRRSTWVQMTGEDGFGTLYLNPPWPEMYRGTGHASNGTRRWWRRVR